MRPHDEPLPQTCFGTCNTNAVARFGDGLHMSPSCLRTEAQGRTDLELVYEEPVELKSLQKQGLQGSIAEYCSGHCRRLLSPEVMSAREAAGGGPRAHMAALRIPML